jgi:hypothetical protein
VPARQVDAIASTIRAWRGGERAHQLQDVLDRIRANVRARFRRTVAKALGLSVEDWVNKRLGGYVRMSAAERLQVIEELKAEGLNNVAIGQVIGVDESQIRRDVSAKAEPSNKNPEPISAMSDASSANAEPIATIAALAADEALHIEARKQQQREAVGLNGGGRPRKTGVELTPVLPSLDAAGIDKHLANRAGIGQRRHEPAPGRKAARGRP